MKNTFGTTYSIACIAFACISLWANILLAQSPQTSLNKEYLIKFSKGKKPDVQKGAFATRFQKANLVSIPGTDYAIITSPVTKNVHSSQDLKELPEFQQLLQSGSILEIEENHPFTMSHLPNDEYVGKQWALANKRFPQNHIGLEQAWDIQTKGAGIMGVVDTGIDYTHPDLAPNIWQNLAEDADGDGKVLEFSKGKWRLDPGDLDGIDADGNGYVDDLVGWDFVNNDNDPFDDNGHGTHVAGIAAARGDNGIGIAGVAWQAEIMVLKSFDAYGSGQLSTILPALEYARKMGVFLPTIAGEGNILAPFYKKKYLPLQNWGKYL